jgi:hypothetical protein
MCRNTIDETVLKLKQNKIIYPLRLLAPAVTSLPSLLSPDPFVVIVISVPYLVEEELRKEKADE